MGAQKKINVILVCYYPDIERLIALLYSLSDVGRVLLVQNSEFKLPRIFSNVKYITPNKNIGTSAAYNLAFKSVSQDCEFVMLLDQDTILLPDFFEKLMEEIRSLIDLERDFIISPIQISQDTGQKMGWGSMFGSFCKNEVRASGMVIPRNILNDGICFNELLFLDYSDWDFCWRLKLYRNVYIHFSQNTQIYHELGGYYNTLFGSMRKNSSPLRLYSQIVGAKILSRFSYVSFQKKVYLLIRILTLPFISLIYLDYPKRFSYIIRGYRDSLINQKFFNE
jgi:rhamnosyltransferase